MRFVWFFICLTATCLGNDWNLDKTFSIRSIVKVALSSDGTKVVYQVQDPLFNGEISRSQPLLFLSDQKTHSTRLIARGGYLPAWSPDDQTIAFLKQQSDGFSQMALYDLSSEKTHTLTDVKERIFYFLWNPLGHELIYLQSDPKLGEKEKILGIEPNQHLWSVSKDGRTVRRITSGPFHLGGCLFPMHFAISPDGKSILSPKISKNSHDLWKEAAICHVDIETGEVTDFLPACSLEPIYSPDGKWVAFLKEEGDWAFAQDVCIVPVEGGKVCPLASTYNRDILKVGALIGWSKDSQSLYVLDYRNTRAELVALPIDRSAPRPITLPVARVCSPALAGNLETIGFVGSNSKLPQEVFVLDLKTQKTQEISNVNASSFDPKSIAHTEKVSWKGEDGWVIEGLLTYPLNHDKKTPFPLLLCVHGGPCFFFSETFIGNPAIYPIATFASRGYGVLRCNIRGSTGYGKAFRDANFKDWGGKDFSDLMHGVDHLIQRGLVDENRLGVMGWSYGGYMSAWAITQTNRFKAASVGAGIANLVSMSGTTDIPSFIANYFGKNFAKSVPILVARSAIANMDSVTTPTLIQHGERDKRVPSSQATELFRALESLNIETALHILPRTGHRILEPKLLREVAEANLAWFTKHLSPA